MEFQFINVFSFKERKQEMICSCGATFSSWQLIVFWMLWRVTFEKKKNLAGKGNWRFFVAFFSACVGRFIRFSVVSRTARVWWHVYTLVFGVCSPLWMVFRLCTGNIISDYQCRHWRQLSFELWSIKSIFNWIIYTF